MGIFGICPEKTGNSIYFPTGRIGLTLANGPILLDYYHRMGTPDEYSPGLSLQGTNTGFLTMLIRIPREKGYFADHAAAFEQNLEGNIVIDRSYKLPHIEFEQSGKKIPLHVAQSSVQDLAVFLLYLKYMSRQNDLLILEEPEISLHPRMQIHLARLIARLVNGGLRVLVSTHSPYFMEKLGHCVLAGSLRNNIDSSQFPTDECLSSSDVAAYGFVRNGGGYDIEMLTVDEKGIDQSEFVDMFSELYDELVALNLEEE
jgi:predicted ATPase